MKKLHAVALLAALCGCHCAPDTGTKTELSIHNAQTVDATAYIAFGADSKITSDAWAFCEGSGLNCSFNVPAGGTVPLPNPDGKYINLTVAFNDPVGCGVTKAEVDANNPDWYDTMDVSLVDGYSNNVEIVYTAPGEVPVSYGPPKGAEGNQDLVGVFPYGCDICVARQNPPCGIDKGTEGCKAGTQYDPHPPCQAQGKTKGGGGTIEIVLK